MTEQPDAAEPAPARRTPSPRTRGAAKKAPARKAPARKAAATKAAASTGAATRTPAKKAPAKKAPAKKAPAKKAPARKAPATRPAPGTTGWRPPAAATAAGSSRRVDRLATTSYGTPEERAQRGRAARAELPRSAAGDFQPLPNRPDPVALLESQAATRVQELIPIRYGRMLNNPFAFYRGAALIMASDLASQPRSTLNAQLCGDAHLANFGAFASPERRLVFDINDFDETNPGPFEWDVKRMVTSFEVAARENGYTDAERREIVLTAAAAYRVSMAQMAAQPNLQVWYDHIEVDQLISMLAMEVDKKVIKKAEKDLAKARTRDSMQVFEKITTVVDGQRRIISQPPLIVPASDIASGVDRQVLIDSVEGMIAQYRETLQSDRRHLMEQFRFVDLARKVVGVGSVGTRCWIVLLEGRDSDDPLFLQVKEAQQSVLEPYTGRSEYEHQGERVVAGQRIMQAASDIFLGWERNVASDGSTRDFYVRQLRDWKASAAIETMTPHVMTLYAKLCAAALAKAHARSGDRIALASYMGSTDLTKANSFDQSMAAFAVSYADQNLKDYAALKKAVDDGRVKAEVGL